MATSETEEEAVLKKYAKNLSKAGELWIGCIESQEVLVSMERDLLTLGVSFKTTTFTHYGQENSKQEAQLCFSLERGILPLRLDMPFRLISKVRKGCLFGKDQHKTQEKRAAAMSEDCKPEWSDKTFKKTKTKLQGTKKKGCVAVMLVKVIDTFPEYKLKAREGISEHKVRRLRTAQLSKLADAFSSGQDVITQRMIFFAMSPRSCHTEHNFSEIINFGQTVDSSICQRIKDLVCEGITSVSEVKKCVRYYVKDVLFAGKQPPDATCRAFHPTNQDIANHIQAALRQERCSDLDQENAVQLVHELKKQDPDSNFFMRTYKESEGASVDDNEDVEEWIKRQCGSTFIFCYQSKFMASLAEKYGSLICLDATNKTTDYALPLFFLVVKTPLCYMVVGTFVVQFETAACIKEALDIFRLWSPGLSPEYFMIDCCQAEIKAINAAFPESKVMLCDFHREQAWERWVRKKENGVESREDALSLLRRMAYASSPHEYDAAYKSLTESVHWTNPRLREYMHTSWLPISHMWVKHYRQDFSIIVTTNNGTESQNKLLKEFYLKGGHGRKSLTALISVLVKQFFPDRLQHFHQANIGRSSCYRMYHETVPEYPQNRPPAAVKHIMSRMETAQCYTEADITDGDEVETFFVKSSVPEKHHIINFGIPSCSCQDFAQTKLLCKHFCAVLLHKKTVSFNSLPETYRSGPLLALDICKFDIPGPPSNVDSFGQQDDTIPANLPRRKTNSFAKLRAEIREGADKLKAMVTYCSERDNLEQAHFHLLEAQKHLAQGTPTSSGITVRGSPVKGCSGQKKRVGPFVSFRAAALKKAKRISQEHWKSRGRFGQKAESIRKGYTAPSI